MEMSEVQKMESRLCLWQNRKHCRCSADRLSGSAALTGQINFDAVINRRLVGSVNGHLRFTNYTRISSAVNNGDPFVVAILEPQTGAEVDKAFGVLMGVKERQCNWTMFEMPAPISRQFHPACCRERTQRDLSAYPGLWQ
jgi:hypothetical protein